MVVMPFRSRNRGMSLRPINRIKHVVDQQAGVTLNNVFDSTIILATDTPTFANTTGVESGSRVNGIYLNVEAYATTAGALANVYIMVMKNPGGNLSFPNPNVVGAQDNKKYVIHQEMRMLEQKVNGNPRTIFNGVIVIPKLYRRFGPNDLLTLRLFAPGVDIFFCMQSHYKEFR